MTRVRAWKRTHRALATGLITVHVAICELRGD